MKPNEHIKRRSYSRYDAERYLLYVNEQPVDIRIDTPDPGLDEDTPGGTDQQTADPQTVPGYSYGGDLPDGGTLIAAAGVNRENLRDKFIAGLVRRRYTQDEVEAIILNGSDTEKHARELEQLQAYRRECKDSVDELLSR